MAKDNPETNPITIKPKTESHVAELFSWVLSTYCSPPGCPFPIKSLALSACFSSDNSFPSVRQGPVSAPGRGPPSYNSFRMIQVHYIYCAFYFYYYYISSTSDPDPRGSGPLNYIPRGSKAVEVLMTPVPKIKSHQMLPIPDLGRNLTPSCFQNFSQI